MAYCGDSIQQAGEQCDDGNVNGLAGQTCTSTCQRIIVTCGNGTVDTGEQCDLGNRNGRPGSTCNEKCQNIEGYCGDAIVESGLGEQCDKGRDFNGHAGIDCTADCKFTSLPECGDSVTDQANEQCDAGAYRVSANGDKTGNGDYANTVCLSNCTLPYCGDGITEVNEQCDLGASNGIPGSGCDAYCRIQNPGAPPITANLIPGRNPPQYQNIPTPARTPTGPGLVIFLASGAAAGIGLARRRYLGGK